MTKQTLHLKDAEFAMLTTADNRLDLLKHIAGCPLCSERLAKSLTAQKLIHAPHYLGRKILAKKQYQKQKKREFISYCVKTGLAVAASLTIILFSDTAGNFAAPELRQETIRTNQESTIKPKKDISQEIYQKTDVLNKKIINFTDSLIHITNLF